MARIDEDLLSFPEDGQRHELIDGEHYVNACPNTKHQAVSGNLYFMIRGRLEQHPVGRIFYGRLTARSLHAAAASQVTHHTNHTMRTANSGIVIELIMACALVRPPSR